MLSPIPDDSSLYFHARNSRSSNESNPTYNIRIPAYVPAHVLTTGNIKLQVAKDAIQGQSLLTERDCPSLSSLVHSFFFSFALSFVPYT